jgi:hypothetical protein
VRRVRDFEGDDIENGQDMVEDWRPDRCRCIWTG